MATGHARIGTRGPAPGADPAETGGGDLDELAALDLDEGSDNVDSDGYDDYRGAGGRQGALVRWWDYLRDPAPESVQPPRRWPPWLAFVLSVFGFGVSIYLTIAHFSSAAILACSDQGVINCAKVTTSPQSEVFGVLPVAVLGLAFYTVVMIVNVPPMWHVRDRRIHLARLALSIIGMGFVLYLLAAELVIIGNICLWCTSVHVVTFALFVLTMATVPRMVGWGPTGEADWD